MQELGRDWLVDGDEADRVAALAVAAEREGRDVDAGLAEERPEGADEAGLVGIAHVQHVRNADKPGFIGAFGDRKSTRLNSSHMSISYAVFCLKKKKITRQTV